MKTLNEFQILFDADNEIFGEIVMLEDSGRNVSSRLKRLERAAEIIDHAVEYLQETRRS